jgi:G-patch domain
MQAQRASNQQLQAGAFYRELLHAGFPVAASQSQSSTPQAVASAPPEPAVQHASIHAAAAQSGGEQQASGLRVSDAAAAAAASEHADADARAGLGSSRRIEIRQPASSREPAGHSSPADTAFVGPSLDYGIPSDNVGFQLLQKAGWQPGAGLGAESQGRRMPLEQSQQKGFVPPTPQASANAAAGEAATAGQTAGGHPAGRQAIYFILACLS